MSETVLIMLVGEKDPLLWCIQYLSPVFKKKHHCISESDATSVSWFFVYSKQVKKNGKMCPLCGMCKQMSPPTAMSSKPHFPWSFLKSPYLKWSICYCCQRLKAMWANYREGVCLTEGLFTSSWRGLFPFCIGDSLMGFKKYTVAFNNF